MQKALPNVVNVFFKNILKKDANVYIIYVVCANMIFYLYRLQKCTAKTKENIKGFRK